MRAEQSTEFTVALNEEEKGVLSRLLQRSLVGFQQEKHHSEACGHRELPASCRQPRSRLQPWQVARFGVIGYMGHLYDYEAAVALGLGSFPDLGNPLDPSESGPLGMLWPDEPPWWFTPGSS